MFLRRTILKEVFLSEIIFHGDGLGGLIFWLGNFLGSFDLFFDLVTVLGAGASLDFLVFFSLATFLSRVSLSLVTYW